MQLLVFAHTPPPIHGQSLMVQTLVEGLGSVAPDIRIFHIDPRLSRDSADIGHWRLGKFFALIRACLHAWSIRARHGPMVLYYVPAPGKRGALYRDWIVMLLCRPIFYALVLHWHAAGLGDWLATRTISLERRVSRILLGRSDLSIVLGENLRGDIALLTPRRVEVIRNGIPDPCPGFVRPPRPANQPMEALFLGLCTRDKGLFAAIEGVLEYNRRAQSEPGSSPVRLTIAGEFADRKTEEAFLAVQNSNTPLIRHIGFVRGAGKDALFKDADVLLFPTVYQYETQGLVVAEALAYDLPVIVTRWRAVHESLPASHVYFVDHTKPAQIADAIRMANRDGIPAGICRRHFLVHYSREPHLQAIATALRHVHSS